MHRLASLFLVSFGALAMTGCSGNRATFAVEGQREEQVVPMGGRLVATFNAAPNPWAREKNRASENVSITYIGPNRRLTWWIVQPESRNVRFNVMEDLRNWWDVTHLRNIAHNTTTTVTFSPEGRTLAVDDLYIANPKGANDRHFTVQVYAD
jgi:hypothetical protein